MNKNTKILTKAFYKQAGVTSVEFAIVGLAALTILFGSLEVARMMFVVNMLEEATRRGARVAAVCVVDSPAVARIAVFNSSGGDSSPFLPKLTTANIQVQYLDEAGVPVTDYSTDPEDPRYYDINFVRVEIVNYQHEMILPGLDLSFQTKGYATTIPIESLGVAKVGQTSTCT